MSDDDSSFNITFIRKEDRIAVNNEEESSDSDERKRKSEEMARSAGAIREDYAKKTIELFKEPEAPDTRDDPRDDEEMRRLWEERDRKRKLARAEYLQTPAQSSDSDSNSDAEDTRDFSLIEDGEDPFNISTAGAGNVFADDEEREERRPRPPPSPDYI